MDNDDAILQPEYPPPAIEAPYDALLDELAPPRAPKQARSRAKRTRLLDAALEVFEAHGYDGATIDAIAAKAGVSVGVFYSYFRSKRQMLLTLSHERVEQLRFNLADIDPAQMTFENLNANLLIQLQVARRFAGLRRARRELGLKDPEIARYEREQRQNLRAQVADLIMRGRKAGRFWPDLDDVAAATAILAMNAQLQEWVTELSEDEERRVAYTAAMAIARLLLADPGSLPKSAPRDDV